MTDFSINGFYPLHVGDRVLGVIPMLGFATANLFNECLELVTVSNVQIRESGGGTITKMPTMSTRGSRNVPPCASAIGHLVVPKSQP